MIFFFFSTLKFEWERGGQLKKLHNTAPTTNRFLCYTIGSLGEVDSSHSLSCWGLQALFCKKWRRTNELRKSAFIMGTWTNIWRRRLPKVARLLLFLLWMTLQKFNPWKQIEFHYCDEKVWKRKVKLKTSFFVTSWEKKQFHHRKEHVSMQRVKKRLVSCEFYS